MWPFTSDSSQHSVSTLRQEYDYIVVGGGNAGCVLARRLAEDGKYAVLLVERGKGSYSWRDKIPMVSQYHFSNGKNGTVMQSTPNVQLGGRTSPLVTGIGLGGTTRINGGQYTCGIPAQFEAWSQQGRQGWSYNGLKPYFDKSENWSGPVPKEYHGLNGPLQVRSFEDYRMASSPRAAEAAQRLGFPDIVDMHSPLEPSMGVNKMQFTIDAEGYRHSSSRAYLPKWFIESRRDNLDICTGVTACKLDFSNNLGSDIRARGVVLQALTSGATRMISARREIILTAGALRTPQLLLLSGIGPEEDLKQLGINVVKNLSGVGGHLQDHMMIPTSYNCPIYDSFWSMVIHPTVLLREIYKYLRYGTGCLLGTLVEFELFGISSLIGTDGKPVPLSKEQLDPFDPRNLPDFAVMLCPISDPNEPGVDKWKGTMSLVASLLLPKSAGRLRLRSADPGADPVCDMNYLSSPDDWAALRAALRVTVALVNEMRAGGYPLDDILVPDVTSDAALDDFIRKRADTMLHYSSSCRMAAEDDEHPGVVDDELRVHGIPNLRIADASVFPNSPAIHPQALVYAVAEKCADHILRAATP